jgi:hypothetical protein
VDETAQKSLSGCPLPDGSAPRAGTLSTFASILHSSSYTSYPSFTLHSIIERELSYVMYMVFLSYFLYG